MEKSTVYFTDFRCPVGTSQLVKLKKLCVAAGIKDIDLAAAPGFLWLSAARRGGSPVQRGPLRPQPRARRRGGFHARAWRPGYMKSISCTSMFPSMTSG